MKKKAALLNDPDKMTLFHIDIETNQGVKVTMIFSDRAMAQAQAQQIKGQGVYGGQWIKSFNYWESNEDTFYSK